MEPLRIGACLAALCWAAAGAQGPGSSDQGELVERLAAVAAAAREELGLSGLAVGVALGGESVLSRGWGYADPAAEQSADPESSFRVGALTTSLVTLGVLMLVDDERLELDDTLATLLASGEPEALGALGELTVDQLLRHTSGVPPLEAPQGQDLLDWLVEQPLEHQPGHCAVYSGGNTYLLGRVLAEVAGLPVQEFVRSAVAAPLELEATEYCATGTPLRETAGSFQELAGELVEDPLLARMFDAAGLCSNLEDLLDLCAALAARELVSDAALDRLRDPAPLPDGTPVTFVGGFSRTPLGQHEGLSLGGGLVGGSVHAAWYPELDLLVVVLANAEDAPLAAVERRLTRAFLGEAGPELAELSLPEEALERYVGGYYVGCLSYLVEARAGQLWLVPSTGPALRLGFLGDDRFAATGDPELHVTFEVLDGLARSLALEDHGFVTVATRM